MTDKDLNELEEILKRSMDILSKNLLMKLNKIIEGQLMLAEKLERMGDRLGRKIDAVALNHLQG